MKKTLIAILVAIMAIPAIARGPHGGFRGPAPRGPRPVPMFHHSHTMHGRDWVGVGFGAAVLGTAVAIAATTPPPPPPPPPTIVVQPAPVVYTAPAPVIVQQPVVQTVVVPARTLVRTETITTTTTVNGVITGRNTKTRYHYSDGTYEDR